MGNHIIMAGEAALIPWSLCCVCEFDALSSDEKNGRLKGKGKGREEGKKQRIFELLRLSVGYSRLSNIKVFWPHITFIRALVGVSYSFLLILSASSALNSKKR